MKKRGTEYFRAGDEKKGRRGYFSTERKGKGGKESQRKCVRATSWAEENETKVFGRYSRKQGV